MQMYVTEAADPEGNRPAHFVRGGRVQKILLNVASTSDDGERDPVSVHIFRGISSDRAPCQRNRVQTLINWR
jgi:hypothetical protein